MSEKVKVITKAEKKVLGLSLADAVWEASKKLPIPIQKYQTMSSYDKAVAASDIAMLPVSPLGLIGLLAQSTGASDYLLGAVEGQFNKKQTVGQILIDASISMFPILGEICAVRDAVAITINMTSDDKELHSTMNWIMLILCVVVVIPVLGGVASGAGKLAVRAASVAGKEEELVKIAAKILALMRNEGVGNALEHLSKLNFTKYLPEINKQINRVIDHLSDVFVSAQRLKATLVLPDRVAYWVEQAPSLLKRVKGYAPQELQAAAKQLDGCLRLVIKEVEKNYNVLHNARNDLKAGSIPFTGAKKLSLMVQEARLSEASTAITKGLGHKPTSIEKYKPFDDWPESVKSQFPTFSRKALIKPVLIKAGSEYHLVRVLDKASPRKTGAFWAETVSKNGMAWRMDYAVKGAWSANGVFIELKHIPSVEELRKLGILKADETWDGIHAWRGKVAEQIDNATDDAKIYNPTQVLLPGGAEQLYIDFRHSSNIPISAYIDKYVEIKPTNWDTNIPGAGYTSAKYLAATELRTVIYAKAAQDIRKNSIATNAAAASAKASNSAAHNKKEEGK